MPCRILLADDSPAVLEMVRTLLETSGFHVVGLATDGREAVELAQLQQPDVAILDLDMPVMSGVEAAHLITEGNSGTRVILLTAYSTEELIALAFRAGVRGYIVKADTADDLVRAIHEVQCGGIFLSPGASRFVVQAFLPEADRT